MSGGSWFVSATNGNDSTGDGTAATPWLTINYAMDNCNTSGGMRSDDRIWVAPGFYDEFVTVDINTGTEPPSEGNEAKLCGDPNLSQAWGSPTAAEAPGQVVIGNWDAGYVGGTSSLRAVLCSYAHFHLCDVALFGGDVSTIVFQGNAGLENQVLVRCVAYGQGVVRYASLEDSVVLGSNDVVYDAEAGDNADARNSVVIGSDVGMNDVLADNCIIIGGNVAIHSPAAGPYNSMLMSGVYGLYNTLATADNNWVFSGLHASSTATPGDSNLFTFSREAIQNNYDNSANYKVWENDTGATGGNVAEEAQTFVLPPAMDIIRNIALAFKPVWYNDHDYTDGGSHTDDSEPDILGFRRTTRDSDHVGQGPWAISNISYSAANSGTIRITQQGEHGYFITVEKDDVVSVSVVCVTSLDGGSAYGSISLSGAGDAAADTATAPDTSETLEVERTATEDGVMLLLLQGNESNVSYDEAYVEFHTLAVTIA